MLTTLDHLYSVDLACDPELRPFYERLRLRPFQGMGTRNRAALADRTRELIAEVDLATSADPGGPTPASAP